jgi:D-3-phosphoglycerate dehydrogenase / 2-oxoglutarate reductase
MTPMFKVLITDYGFNNVEQEKQVIEAAGGELTALHCKSEDEIIDAAQGVAAIIVQFAPVTEKVIKSLTNCKIIVRYGIGYDNVDIRAAKGKGIIVCNVPDYCIDEVADHTLALALTLARQIPAIDKRTREGVWKMAPVSPMPAFKDMVFATIGFGRIAKGVLARAGAFGFRLAAYDPFVKEEVFKESSVERIKLENIFKEADILSLNSPLTPETKHIVNKKTLASMKPASILVNTSRGGLIDTDALTDALQNDKIGYAGLDVFEEEPLPVNSPIRKCKNTILTSHVSYYSEASLLQLQKMAAEEVVRCIKGKPVKNRIV